jgi:hypothetical protein
MTQADVAATLISATITNRSIAHCPDVAIAMAVFSSVRLGFHKGNGPHIAVRAVGMKLLAMTYSHMA